MQDVDFSDRAQESMALPQILALGNAQVEQGKVFGVDEAFARVRSTVEANRGDGRRDMRLTQQQRLLRACQGQ
jgi:hypothetical protein